MATEAQRVFFNRLLTDREFPAGSDLDKLRADFANVPDKSASAWIERALTFPERGEVPPPF